MMPVDSKNVYGNPGLQSPNFTLKMSYLKNIYSVSFGRCNLEVSHVFLESIDIIEHCWRVRSRLYFSESKGRLELRHRSADLTDKISLDFTPEPYYSVRRNCRYHTCDTLILAHYKQSRTHRPCDASPNCNCQLAAAAVTPHAVRVLCALWISVTVHPSTYSSLL